MCQHACAVAAFTNEAPGRLILETPMSARGKVADVLGECGQRIGNVTDTDSIDMWIEKRDRDIHAVKTDTRKTDTHAVKTSRCVEGFRRVCSVSVDEAKRAFLC